VKERRDPLHSRKVSPAACLNQQALSVDVCKRVDKPPHDAQMVHIKCSAKVVIAVRERIGGNSPILHVPFHELEISREACREQPFETAADMILSDKGLERFCFYLCGYQ
jgi:hypothetical protein